MTFVAKHKKYVASQNSENSPEDKFQNDKKYFFDLVMLILIVVDCYLGDLNCC
jgi:hypothetical protein